MKFLEWNIQTHTQTITISIEAKVANFDAGFMRKTVESSIASPYSRIKYIIIKLLRVTIKIILRKDGHNNTT